MKKLKILKEAIKTPVEKKLRVPVDPLLEKCNKAIVEEIAKEFREEAKEVMRLTTEEIRKEFLGYYEEDKGNICCLVIDTAKRKLIAEGKMTANDDDAFGKPFML